MRTLSTRFAAWIARLGAEDLIAATPAAADHAWPLRKAERAAAHQMTEAEEELAAELNLTGGSAWNRLHGDVTSRLTRRCSTANGTLPMTVVRDLAIVTDAGVRQAAYDAELAAWETRRGAARRRAQRDQGRGQRAQPPPGLGRLARSGAVHQRVDRATLDAMQEAVVALAARLPPLPAGQGRGCSATHGAGLPWWDLFAPVGDPPRASVDVGRGHCGAVLDAFGSVLAGAGRAGRPRAFDERWIDAEPRAGKVGGAFCMPVAGDESRVLLNFDGTFDSVQTLAHELGHAYHNTNLGRPHADAAPDADGAGRDGQHLLRDDHGAGRPGRRGRRPARGSRCSTPTCTGPRQVVVDIHSPLPVRAGAVRPPGRAQRCRCRS